MTYGRKKASFAPAELPGPHRGDLGRKAAAGTSKKHFIFAAEKMKNSLLTL